MNIRMKDLFFTETFSFVNNYMKEGPKATKLREGLNYFNLMGLGASWGTLEVKTLILILLLEGELCGISLLTH